eukprot:4014412-Amphidinium_carterae.1
MVCSQQEQVSCKNGCYHRAPFIRSCQQRSQWYLLTLPINKTTCKKSLDDLQIAKHWKRRY